MHTVCMHTRLEINSQTWISMQPGFWDLGQGSTFFVRVDIGTAGLWTYPVKYFMLLRGVLPTQKHVVMLIF